MEFTVRVKEMAVGNKHSLLVEVFSSLSDGQFTCANEIKLAMLLCTYYVQQSRFSDVLFTIRENKSHCLKQQFSLKVDTQVLWKISKCKYS